MARDPICGMYVDETTATIKSFKYGKNNYFCSEACKDQFDEPERELKKLKFLLALSWILTIPVILFTYLFHFEYWTYVTLVMASVVQFYPGLRFYLSFVP